MAAWTDMSMCTIENRLGHGTFGEALVVRKKLDRKLYVIKPIAQFSDSEFLKRSMHTEAFLLMAMNHPNVARVFGYFQEGDKMLQVMEHCESDLGTEIEAMVRKNEFFPEARIYNWTKQLASAVAYLHDSLIIHSNIKPRNVLLREPSQDTICLSDFGSSHMEPDISKGSEFNVPLAGTPIYLPPEMLHDFDTKPSVSYKRDVWAFGATVYEIATLKSLFEVGASVVSFLRMASEFNSLLRERRLEMESKKVNPDVITFLDYVLHPDPDKRPSMSDVVSQHFLDDLPYIFISYSWKNKGAVLRIKDELVKWHFQVWIDDQNIYGNITDRTAEAIEQSSVILICYSHDYARSRSCKAEADYIFRVGKAFIPLKMQDNYTPKGWLSIILGNELFYDFSNDQVIPFDRSFAGLVEGLRRKGRYPEQHRGSAAATVSFATSPDKRRSALAELRAALSSRGGRRSKTPVSTKTFTDEEDDDPVDNDTDEISSSILLVNEPPPPNQQKHDNTILDRLVNRLQVSQEPPVDPYFSGHQSRSLISVKTNRSKSKISTESLPAILVAPKLQQAAAPHLERQGTIIKFGNINNLPPLRRPPSWKKFAKPAMERVETK